MADRNGKFRRKAESLSLRKIKQGFPVKADLQEDQHMESDSDQEADDNAAASDDEADDDWYEVERVLSVRTIRNQRQAKVRWK